MLNIIKSSSICYLFSAFLFLSCNSKIEVPDEKEEWPLRHNVYVAGTEYLTEGIVARLWKNGKIETLEEGISKSTSESVLTSEAYAVFVSGIDVYVAGSEFIKNGSEVKRIARLWKNGKIQPLTIGDFFSEAFSVFVSGEDVYVLGRESTHPNPESGLWVFKYWKNGESIIFAQGGSKENYKSIFVSDDDVYIVGTVTKYSGLNFPFYQAKLWKNGTEENLISETTDSWTSSVFVSGKDVYVVGKIGDYPDKQTSVATLWKNGKIEKLSNGTNPASANSIYVSDNDMYIAGEDAGAKLWKNCIVQDVDKDANTFLSVFVLNNDVYTLGYVSICEPISISLSICHLQATLWRNGKKLSLETVDKNNASIAYSVFVK